MASTRLTKQKQEFRRFLELNKEKEMTVSEIAELLKQSGSDMGIATVYRAVNRLEAEGALIKTVSGSNGKATYRYASSDESVRSIHRIFCTCCGKTADLPYKFTDKLDKNVSDSTGYTVTDHQILFYGLCKDCRN